MKNILIFSYCFVALALITVSACKTKKQAPAPVVSTSETKKITYTANIKSSIDYFCVSCHSAANKPKGIALETYAQIKASAANKNFLGAINHQSGYAPMPPNLGGAKMPAETIRDITSWIEGGMAE